MNIVEYRAMVASEQVESPKGEEPNVQTNEGATTNHEQTNPTPNQESQAPTATGEQNQTQTEPESTEAPLTVEVDGKQVSIDELKSGYMRQSDYTRKTQEVSKIKSQAQLAQEFYQAVASKPELAEQLSKEYGIPYVDPKEAQFIDLNNRYQDLLLQQEITELKGRYDDFDVQGVLQFAYDNKHENLEDAYLLYKAKNQASAPADPIDADTLKDQIRQEILAELQSNVDTGTIIQSRNDTQQVRDDAPVLTPEEVRVARNLKMEPVEYAKWRDKR